MDEVATWRTVLSVQYLEEEVRMLRVTFAGGEQATPLFATKRPWLLSTMVAETKSELPPGIQCESLGPSVLGNMDIARLWDKIALTDDENRAIGALKADFW